MGGRNHPLGVLTESQHGRRPFPHGQLCERPIGRRLARPGRRLAGTPRGKTPHAVRERREEIEGDETGYFFQRDASAVRQEMLRWLSAVSRIVVENCQDASNVGVRMVSM